MVKILTGTAILLLAGNAIAAGCPNADVPELTEAQRTALQTRAEARWQVVQNKDIAASYAYTTPNYRQVFPLDLYRARFTGPIARQLQSLQVAQRQHADPAVVAVKAKVLTLPQQSGQTPNNPDWQQISTQIIEKWVCTRGEWWYHPQP